VICKFAFFKDVARTEQYENGQVTKNLYLEMLVKNAHLTFGTYIQSTTEEYLFKK